MKFTRTKTTVAVIAAIVVLFCLGAFSPLAALERVRVGLSSISATSGAVWVAEEKGLFKKYGIDPEVIIIGGGGGRVVSSLIAGEIQFAVGGGDAVVRAKLKGADVVQIVSPLVTGLQRVMARPEIKSPVDLKGKRIGITRFGSASHLVLQLVMRKWGMAPEDLAVLQVGSSPAMLASLDKGGIDAAVLTMPSFFVAEERGYRLLADLGEMELYYPQNTIESSRGYIGKQRAPTLSFVKGVVEGIAYFKKNKRPSLEVLRKKLRIQSEQERESRHLENSYELLAGKYYNEAPYPSMKSIETVLNFMAAEDPKIKGLDPKTFADESFVKELDQSGFIKALYGR